MDSLKPSLVPAEPPRVLKYESGIKYLNEYYYYRKAKDPDFSYELWASESGIRSRSYLRLVCIGKRKLTDTFIAQYSKNHKFTENEKNHFYLISQYSNTAHEMVKKIFINRIHEMTEFVHDELEAEAYSQFLNNPLNLIIQVLTGFKDVEITSLYLAQILKTDLSDILKSLKVLESLKLVRSTLSTESGHRIWQAAIRPFKIKDSFASAGLTQFYIETLKQAQKKASEDSELSRYRTLLFPIQAEQYEEIKNDIEDFLRKLKSKYGSKSIKYKHLMQLNLQMYPLTEKVRTES